jgi:uncharacterized protein YoxC
MFATSSDVLHMSLAIGFMLFIIFLCILIFYVILILRDTSKVVDGVAEIVNRVRVTIVQPLKAIDFLIERAKPYIDTILEKRMKEKKSSKSK